MSLLESLRGKFSSDQSNGYEMNPARNYPYLSIDQLPEYLVAAGSNMRNGGHEKTQHILQHLYSLRRIHPHINFNMYANRLHAVITDNDGSIINLCKNGSYKSHSFLLKAEHHYKSHTMGGDSIIHLAQTHTTDPSLLFVDSGCESGVQSLNFVVHPQEIQYPHLVTIPVTYDRRYGIGTVLIPGIEVEQLLKQ